MVTEIVTDISSAVIRMFVGPLGSPGWRGPLRLGLNDGFRRWATKTGVQVFPNYSVVKKAAAALTLLLWPI